MANWAQFGHFHLGVYSLLWPAVLDIKAVCWVIWGDSKCTLLYKLNTHYFTLYQCIIYSVLSHENIHVRAVLTSVRYCTLTYFFVLWKGYFVIVSIVDNYCVLLMYWRQLKISWNDWKNCTFDDLLWYISTKSFENITVASENSAKANKKLIWWKLSTFPLIDYYTNVLIYL